MSLKTNLMDDHKSEILGISKEIRENVFSEYTVDSTGVILEELKEKAQKMTEAASLTKFYLNLAKIGVGTHSVESKAYKLVLDRNCKEGKKAELNDNIYSGRDPEMVDDLLKIKIKYARRAEDFTKNVFDTEMRRVEEKIEKGTRRWRN